MNKRIIKTENFEVVIDENGEYRVFLNDKEVEVEGGSTLLLTESESYDISLEEIYFLPFSYHIIDDSTGVLPSPDHSYQGHIATIMDQSLDQVTVSYIIMGDRENFYPSQSKAPLNEEYLSKAYEVIISHDDFEFVEQASFTGFLMGDESEENSDKNKNLYQSDIGPISFTTEIKDVKTYGELIQRMDQISRDLDIEIIQQIQSIN